MIYGRRWTPKVALLTLLASIGMGERSTIFRSSCSMLIFAAHVIAGAVFLITFGVIKHDFLGDIPKFTEIGLFGIDLFFNAIATCGSS